VQSESWSEVKGEVEVEGRGEEKEKEGRGSISANDEDVASLGIIRSMYCGIVEGDMRC
jgi:hypothetical protein